MSLIAFIPAKSHSSRLPGKNLKKLSGKNLFLHSVVLALNCPIIDDVYISSDNNEILALGKNAGAISLSRPQELCQNKTTNFEVICYHIQELKKIGKKINEIVLLQPTTPFRTVKELQTMLFTFKDTPEVDSLLTIKKNSRLHGKISNGFWKPNQVDLSSGRIQNNNDSHEFTGHVLLFRVNKNFQKIGFLGDKTLAIPLPSNWPDIDIDTHEDWLLAEAYAAHNPLWVNY